MHDDLNAPTPESRENNGEAKRPSSREPVRRVSDREVPIGGTEGTHTSDLVHAWLDGELPETAVSGADATRQIEFWKRVDRDLEQRRYLVTPADLTQKIMDALPATAPATATPWWSRPIAMSPIAVAAAATSLLALGAAIGATIRR
ncbi:MAG TPA: hypothetical protein VNV25_23490 [Gemmatimonadaceae bacterium]|jgi:hypothetical protein|nr:hypothetical protein [Gemmatimonadaceae bacterium]